MVEYRTDIAEVMGSNPVGASEFFLGFLTSQLRRSISLILYSQFTHMMFIIYTSRQVLASCVFGDGVRFQVVASLYSMEDKMAAGAFGRATNYGQDSPSE